MPSTEYKERFAGDPVYRINEVIMGIQSQGAQITRRCLSEPIWGLAEACHIVAGTLSPSRFGNNIDNALEREAHNFCVKHNQSLTLSPIEGDANGSSYFTALLCISYLYNHARASVASGSLPVVDKVSMDGFTKYEFLPLVFLEWCQAEGVMLRPELVHMLTSGKATPRGRPKRWPNIAEYCVQLWKKRGCPAETNTKIAEIGVREWVAKDKILPNQSDGEAVNEHAIISAIEAVRKSIPPLREKIATTR